MYPNKDYALLDPNALMNEIKTGMINVYGHNPPTEMPVQQENWLIWVLQKYQVVGNPHELTDPNNVLAYVRKIKPPTLNISDEGKKFLKSKGEQSRHIGHATTRGRYSLLKTLLSLLGESLWNVITILGFIHQ